MRSLVAAVMVAGGYFTLLVAFSVQTGSRDLRLGDSLCFGDWCASVMQAAHQGGEVAVTLRTESRRDGAPVWPDQPEVRVIDDGGRQADLVGNPAPPLDAPLQPGESLTRELVFSTPPGASELHVEITHDPWFNKFLIGSDGAPFHGRARIKID